MSATAGPSSGLTSSITEVCPAPPPTPVNHVSGAGAGQSSAARLVVAEAGREQAGRLVALRGDHDRVADALAPR